MMVFKQTVFEINLTQVAYASNTRGCSQSSSMSSSSSPVTSFAALSADKEDLDLTLFKGVGAKPLTLIKNEIDKIKYDRNIMIIINTILRKCMNKKMKTETFATSSGFLLALHNCRCRMYPSQVGSFPEQSQV